MIVASLPVTRNGKTDYQALKDREIEASPASPGSSGDGATASLLQIWSEMLGRADISPDDSFFECGGDSLTPSDCNYRSIGVLGLTCLLKRSSATLR